MAETQDEFTNFRFKSFRTHKLIEEDYSLLQVEEPEEAPMIFSKEILPDERLVKDGVELVAIDEKQLNKRTKEVKTKKQVRKNIESRQRAEDSRFIRSMEGDTSKYLDIRWTELQKFLDKKQ